jgi:hypothetical protein
MDKDYEDRSVNPLIRIANALEEILRLVKEDQERSRGLQSLQDIAEEKKRHDVKQGKWSEDE